MSDPVFLPYVRRGLSQAAGTPDPLAGPLPASTTVRAVVDLEDSNGAVVGTSTTRRLAGPADVTGVDRGQIIRYEPAPGTQDFETNYLPFVEILASDLPWLVTPASPTAEGALRPWLVLVVVADGPAVTFEERAEAVDLLHIAGDAVATELWDLADSHLWVHAQSATENVEADLERGGGSVIARFLCPRKLETSTSYRAALVPAFDGGVAAAQGLPFDATQIQPAWSIDDQDDVTLPVYATWTFATSAEPGDFEMLAERLRPDSGGNRMGFHGAVLDTGPMLANPNAGMDFGFEFEGALVDPGQRGAELPRATKRWYEQRMVDAIDRGQRRTSVGVQPPANYLPDRQDPVLAPQLYGRWPANRSELPKRGWVQAVNVDPAYRAAAGLGAEVVRQAEHEFLASAWDQVGSLREAEVELNRARLAAEVSERQHTKLSALDDATLLFVTGRIKHRTRVPGSAVGSFGRKGGGPPRPGSGQVQPVTVAESLNTDPVLPAAVVSAAFYRAARRGSSIARQAALPTGLGLATAVPAAETPASPAARSATAFLSAASPLPTPTEYQAAELFKASFVPDGAVLVGNTVSIRPGGKLMQRSFALQSASGLLPDGAGIMRNIQPGQRVAAKVTQRITGIDPDAAFPVDGSRSRIIVGPWFPDGLSPRLQALSPEYLLPGVGEFGMDRVRLLEINEAFVASFLIGANHEWAREALWREFPADLSATAFASLFDRPGNPPSPGPDTDLNDELAAIKTGKGLASMIGGQGSGTVLLIRAELVRRFPGLITRLLRPLSGGLPLDDDGLLLATHTEDPMFMARMDESTTLVGFDVDPKVVLDQGWYVSLEEPPAGPRFGFDDGGNRPRSQPPNRWDNLRWIDLLDDGATHVRRGSLGWDGIGRGGVRWGRNGSHQARIAFQQPFRMVFPADALILNTSGGQ